MNADPTAYDGSWEGDAWRIKAAYRAAWHIRLGERRDAAAQPRPEGCWCEGIGGRGEKWLPETKQFVLEWSCHGCPEGDMAREDYQNAHVAERMNLSKKRAETFLESLPFRYAVQTLATYPVTTAAQTEVLRRVNAWIDAWEGDPDSRWLLLHGSFGTGKSGLAAAIAHEILTRGHFHKAYFVEVPALLDRIRYTFKKGAEESEEDVMADLLSDELLVLDDLGAERATDWATERLFTVLNQRYEEEHPTIITSNLTPSELGAHLGERAMWRIAEMADVVSLEKCPNLRLAKVRAKKINVPTTDAEAA